jgi:ribosomal protein S18 acetylase RimI-like enzyme
MKLSIEEAGPRVLPRYAEVPISFEVESVLRVDPIDGGLGGVRLVEEKVVPSYVKDYDALEGGGPQRWPERFDTSNWGILVARDGERLVGGAALAYSTPGVHVLAGRRDIAALWDLRVRPECRRSGIGTELLDRCVAWCRERGLKQLKIETQNINVPACRFYAKQGCRLGVIDFYAYAECPEVAHETMLIWYLDL